jgi:redox-sensing transcriptional repressor
MAAEPRHRGVPAVTVPRLALYLRKLRELQAQGIGRVSSQQLAARVDLNAAQIRKDFSYFGEFGVRGVGYDVGILVEQISRCLGLDRSWNVIIVGAGQLGTALAWYRGFAQQGFQLVGVFDSSSRKVGANYGGGQVLDVSGLERFCAERRHRGEPVDIAMITVPVQATQATVDTVAAVGVRAILNFSPVRVTAPDHVVVRTVDFTGDLMFLSFMLRHDEEAR